MNTSNASAARSARLRKAWSTVGVGIVTFGIGWSLGRSWLGDTLAGSVPGGTILSSLGLLISSGSVVYKIPGVLILVGLIGLLVGSFHVLKNYFR